MDRRASILRLAGTAALLAGALLAAVARPAGPAPDSADRGHLLYAIHCASCHGARGHGDGSMTRYLNVKPADLTRLSERNAGVFPAERVRRTIDGRDEVPGHGSRDMPVWGATFRAMGDMGQSSDELEQEIASRIELLVAHLERLQGDPAAPAEPAPAESASSPPPTTRR